MLTRDNLLKCFAAILPVFVLIGSFLVVKINSQNVAEAACNGRVPKDGKETPPVQDLCPDPGQVRVNSTWETAYFFVGNLPDREEDIQKWWRYQSWMYDDGVSCATSVEKNIPKTGWSGWWAGKESKYRTWHSGIDEFVIDINSRTLQYESTKIGGVDYICPKWHQSLQILEECGSGRWYNYDPNVDFSEAVIGVGVVRRGRDSGLEFSCHPYPSDISF